ncbi:MAG: hypothetical protein ACRDGA_04635 [Bacteroidota bacterium]
MKPVNLNMVMTLAVLSFALVESADAADLTTAKVKRIARAVANQEITARASGLSVNTANSAATTNSANTANSANPVLFATVQFDGQVFQALSKGISQANVTSPQIGVYCFSGLPATKGGQVTLLFASADSSSIIPGDALVCPQTVQFAVITYTDGVLTDSGFYLHLYQ